MSDKCNKCGVDLVVGGNWYPSSATRRDYKCKECVIKRSMLWESKNRDRVNHNSNIRRYRLGTRRPMSENKRCSLYLGVHIAEQVLCKVFKDVEQQPRNNPGFDFICNKGKRIDVKSGCLKNINSSNSMGWQFHIDRNTTADYFLCLAFDNLNNLNPLHIWLIPSEKICHLKMATTSTTSIEKWDEYKLKIGDVVNECDNMRIDNE